MRFKSSLITIPFLAMAITGCDTWSHIRRTDQTLTAPPKIGCIEATLKKIDSIVFEDYDLSKSYSLGGTTFHHNYSYKLKNLPSYVDGAGYDRAYLTITTNYSENFTYTNGYRKPGTESISEKERKIIKSTMKEVEDYLIKRCSISINSSLDEG